MNIREQSAFVYDILINIIEDVEYEQKLINQIFRAQIIQYQYTGYGVFVSFGTNNVFPSDQLPLDYLLQGLLIESPEYESPYTEAMLKTNNGFIKYLEIDAVTTGDYPKSDLKVYKLINAWKQGYKTIITPKNS